MAKQAADLEVTEDKNFEQSLRSLKATLDEQPKKTINLRQLSTEEGGPLPDETVCINGLIYLMQRGVDISVPESVYNVLHRSGRLR